MTKLTFSLPLTVCVYIACCASSETGVASALATPHPSSRRSFVNQALVASTGATMGWVLTQQQQQLQHPGGCACGQCSGGSLQHGASCNCGMCSGQNDGTHVVGCQCGSCLVAASHSDGCNCGMCSSTQNGHDAGCDCAQCGTGGLLGLNFRPASASAFEKRTIGGESRSATTAAFNIQNEKTYERLEKSGFPLDTRAEEQARLSEALTSFSYPSSSGSSNGKKSNEKAKK